MHTRNTILFLGIFLFSLQACRPGPEVISADPKWKIYQNESRWKVESSRSFANQEPFWRFSLIANRIWPLKYKYDQFLHATNIPRQAGRYLIIEGFNPGIGSNRPVSFEFQEIDVDVFRRAYRLNDDADNHISITHYDSETGLISGSFYTEWFRIDGEEEELQILACEEFTVLAKPQ